MRLKKSGREEKGVVLTDGGAVRFVLSSIRETPPDLYSLKSSYYNCT